MPALPSADLALVFVRRVTGTSVRFTRDVFGYYINFLVNATGAAVFPTALGSRCQVPRVNLRGPRPETSSGINPTGALEDHRRLRCDIPRFAILALAAFSLCAVAVSMRVRESVHPDSIAKTNKHTDPVDATSRPSRISP